MVCENTILFYAKTILCLQMDLGVISAGTKCCAPTMLLIGGEKGIYSKHPVSRFACGKAVVASLLRSKPSRPCRFCGPSSRVQIPAVSIFLSFTFNSLLLIGGERGI